jgi:ZIP family zinc transporter
MFYVKMVSMEALTCGLISSGSLLIGATLALRFKFSQRILGFIMAFGVGALISSVSFELIEESFNTVNGLVVVGLGVAAGALVYFFGDLLIDKLGGRHRKSSVNKSGNGSGVAILLGTILDGIPESLVIGLGLASGQAVSIAMVVAVFLSNLPEAMASSTGLLKSGWRKSRIFGLWVIIVAVSAVAAWAGFTIFGDASPAFRAFILAFAGGAILTMLADSMMPEAYRDSGKVTGLIVVLGFCVAFAVGTID